MSETDYLLDNAWQKARERLTLQERFADEATHRRIVALGLERGQVTGSDFYFLTI